MGRGSSQEETEKNRQFRLSGFRQPVQQIVWLRVIVGVVRIIPGSQSHDLCVVQNMDTSRPAVSILSASRQPQF